MAAPITLIVLALQLLNGPLQHHDKQQFVVGACFPDISHLGCIAEEKTHIKKVSWQSIVEEPSSFKAGMKFHTLSAKLREEFVEQHDMLSHLSYIPYKASLLKFIEDTILYAKVDDWQTVAHYFEDVLEEELAFGIERKEIMRWHTIIKQYCHTEPNVKMLGHITQHLPTVAATFNLLSGTVDSMVRGIKSNRKLTRLVNEMYTSFPALLEESNSPVCVRKRTA